MIEFLDRKDFNDTCSLHAANSHESSILSMYVCMYVQCIHIFTYCCISTSIFNSYRCLSSNMSPVSETSWAGVANCRLVYICITHIYTRTYIYIYLTHAKQAKLVLHQNLQRFLASAVLVSMCTCVLVNG